MSLDYAIAIAVVFVVVFVIILRSMRKLGADRTQEGMSRFTTVDIIRHSPNAVFLGQERLGPVPGYGSGVLVLTHNELYFEMWAPRCAFCISLASVSLAEETETFLGKKTRGPVLHVRFTNEEGAPDAIAWQVEEAGGWVADLEQLI